MHRTNRQFKHELLGERLRRDIVAMLPGEPILPVNELMAKFSVSQATVVKAIEGLCEGGLLKKSAGQGTFVTEEVLKYKQGAPPVICIAVPRWTGMYFFQLENIFSSLAEKLGYYAEILHYNWTEEVPDKIPQRKIDAVLVVPAGGQMHPESVAKLSSIERPYVVFGRELKEFDVDCVFSDDSYAGALAASHLISKGHKELAVLVSEPRNAVTVARLKGFLEQAALHGVPVRTVDCEIEVGDNTLPKTYAASKRLFSCDDFKATAVFAMSDTSALAAIKAIHESGRRIPEDISIIACNGDELAAYFHPSLTVVNDPLEEMMQGAVALLMKRVAGKGADACVKLNYKPILFPRESSGSVPPPKRR